MNRSRRPFWLPASNYYVLSVGISAAFFFLIWGILHDNGDETPWVTAGISASMLVCGAVILREVILRRARSRFLRGQRTTNSRDYGVQPRIGGHRHPHKLSLERNAAILADIKQKSDAAKVLNKFSSGHREVFELCSEYIARNETELRTVTAGSPRLEGLIMGRSAAAKFHRYHLLRWAEIEAQSLTGEARDRSNADERIEAAQKALSVIESALESYPAESTLLESQELLRELVVSIKVRHWVENAERAAFRGDYATAKSLYRDALYYLERDNVQNHDREQAAIVINAEIERLRTLEHGE